MSLAANFRINLRRAISADKRSLKDIAAHAGYSESYVGRVLSGLKPNPSLFFIECMAEALKAKPIDLLKESK